MFVEIVSSLLIGVLLWYYVATYRQRRKMPPGPFPLPLIGNSHLLGSDPPYTMENLRAKYGAMYTLTFPIGNVVVINRAKEAVEVLQTRKDDFSGRPYINSFPFDVVFEAKNIVFGDFNPQLIFRRRIVTSALHVFGEGKQQAEQRVNKKLEELLDWIAERKEKPFDLHKHLAVTMLNIIGEWLFSTGFELGDPTLDRLFDLNDKLLVLFRQGSMYHYLPFLRYLPTEFMKHTRDVVNTRDEFFGKQLSDHRKTYKEGVIRDITDALLASYEKEKNKDRDKDVGTSDDIKFYMVDLFFGASDTTTASSLWFIVYMILYEDVQEKIHEELDKVVGRARLPCWNDAPNLPYLQATISELLRHSASVPFNLPHKAMCDTTIQGYHIPKGTAVFFNFWRIHSNTDEWEEPQVFKPERFLDANGEFIGWNANPAFLVFGVGRRACPGHTLGKMQIFLVLSKLLHQFQFKLPIGDPKPSRESVAGFIRFPKHFNLIAKKRF